MTDELYCHTRRSGQQKKISNVSSSQGSIGDTKNAMLYFYRPSKAALNMAVKRLAAELAPRGITVLSHAVADQGMV